VAGPGSPSRRGDAAADARRQRHLDIGPLGFVLAILIALVALACTTSTGTSGSSIASSSSVAGPAGSSTPGATALAGSVPPGTAEIPRPAGAPVDFGAPGPYHVGMLRLMVGDTKVVVFYPADEAHLQEAEHITSYSSGEAFSPQLRATVASIVPEFVQDIPLDAYADATISEDGPFPVIVHSHGFGGFYLFGSQHFSQEASWGFVVAAPDHLSRNLATVASGTVDVAADADVTDLANTLDLLTKQNADPASPIMGGLDTQMVGAEGHSAGGRASYLFAAKEPRVKAWIGQAPSAPVRFEAGDEALTAEERLAKLQAALADAPVLGKPSMIVAGEKDSVVPLTGNRVEYEWLAPPARLVVVKNSGHAGFIDVCKPIRDQGGLQKYAEKLPAFAPLFKLGDDGCGADNIDPVKASAFTNHVMIAEYRYVFGLDSTDASLREDYLRREFPDAFLEATAK
jgi:pimeloyl-ACP methyl ester carboxylesterase